MASPSQDDRVTCHRGRKLCDIGAATRAENARGMRSSLQATIQCHVLQTSVPDKVVQASLHGFRGSPRQLVAAYHLQCCGGSKIWSPYREVHPEAEVVPTDIWRSRVLVRSACGSPLAELH